LVVVPVILLQVSRAIYRETKESAINQHITKFRSANQSLWLGCSGINNGTGIQEDFDNICIIWALLIEPTDESSSQVSSLEAYMSFDANW
jgi:hypothetical protein